MCAMFKVCRPRGAQSTCRAAQDTNLARTTGRPIFSGPPESASSSGQRRAQEFDRAIFAPRQTLGYSHSADEYTSHPTFAGAKSGRFGLPSGRIDPVGANVGGRVACECRVLLQRFTMPDPSACGAETRNAACSRAFRVTDAMSPLGGYCCGVLDVLLP